MSREVMTTQLERTRLSWRDHFKFTTGPLPLYRDYRTVEVILQPGESKSVQVGPREYVIIRRPPQRG